MKLRRTYPLLAAVAVLGDRGLYRDRAHHRTAGSPTVNSATAPPSDRAVNSGEAAPLRTAARSPDAAGRAPSIRRESALGTSRSSNCRSRGNGRFFRSRAARRPPPRRPMWLRWAVRTPSKPAEPERPSITLLGTILGSTESIGFSSIRRREISYDCAWVKIMRAGRCVQSKHARRPL